MMPSRKYSREIQNNAKQKSNTTQSQGSQCDPISCNIWLVCYLLGPVLPQIVSFTFLSARITSLSYHAWPENVSVHYIFPFQSGSMSTLCNSFLQMYLVSLLPQSTGHILIHTLPDLLHLIL